MGSVYKLDLCISSSSPSAHESFLDDPMTRALFERDQPLAILYNGNVCVCDTIELQAKTIIWHATELEARTKKMERLTTNALSLQFRLLHDLRGPSMKRSLQLFLQGRRKKARMTSKH